MDTTDIENILLDKGVKATSNRILVVRELLAATHPISLADLELLLDPMDKASIFRVLELLSEKEIVHVIEDGSRSLKYEMCFNHGHHSISDQHVHFHCDRCKETFCFKEIPVPAIDIPVGFTPRAVNYVLKGLCPQCQNKAGE